MNDQTNLVKAVIPLKGPHCSNCLKLIVPVLTAFLLTSAHAAESGLPDHKEQPITARHTGCPDQFKGVKTEKSAITSGIELRLTADTPEGIAELQKRTASHLQAKDCPLLNGADMVGVENMEKGVKVTLTAKQSSAVKQLQAPLKKAHGCACCGGGAGKSAVKSSAVYVCPMGDFEGSDKPGKCPKCGMNLVKNN